MVGAATVFPFWAAADVAAKAAPQMANARMTRAIVLSPVRPLIGGSLLQADYRRRAAEKRCYFVGMVAARRHLPKGPKKPRPQNAVNA